MDKDFYNAVNSDIIQNKEIQKVTGVSPAKDKWALINSKPHSRRAFETRYSWRKLWKYELAREHAEGVAPPYGWQWTYYDFDRAHKVAFPFGIALFVSLWRFIVRKQYEWVRFLRSHESVTHRHYRELEEAFNAGVVRGREIEFKAQQGMLKNANK